MKTLKNFTSPQVTAIILVCLSAVMVADVIRTSATDYSGMSTIGKVALGLFTSVLIINFAVRFGGWIAKRFK